MLLEVMESMAVKFISRQSFMMQHLMVGGGGIVENKRVDKGKKKNKGDW